MGEVRRFAGLRELWSIGREADAAGLYLSLGLGLAGSVLAPLFPLLLSRLIDDAARGEQTRVTVLAVGVAAVLAGSGAARSYASMFAWNVWERATTVVDERLVGLTTRLGLVDRLEEPAFQERLTVVRTDRERFQQSVISVTVAALLGLQLLLTVVILVLVAPLLLVLPVLSGAPVVASRFAQRRSEAARRSSAPDARAADGFGLLALEPTAAGEVRVLRLRDLLLVRRRAGWDRMVARQWHADAVGTVVSAAGLAVFTGGFAASLLYVTQRSLGGAASLAR